MYIYICVCVNMYINIYIYIFAYTAQTTAQTKKDILNTCKIETDEKQQTIVEHMKKTVKKREADRGADPPAQTSNSAVI